LELPGPRVSQHLGLMRLHRIVEERRDGRQHFYSLVYPEIAVWIRKLPSGSSRVSASSRAE
jgi:DNA-binding transcriptional ArsR family regulator